MKLRTSFVFYYMAIFNLLQQTMLNGSTRRKPYFNKKFARVQRLWSEENDERISDKMMEEDYFERFFETFVKTMHDCLEVW